MKPKDTLQKQQGCLSRFKSADKLQVEGEGGKPRLIKRQL
jgi:hypothetical protein